MNPNQTKDQDRTTMGKNPPSDPRDKQREKHSEKSTARPDERHQPNRDDEVDPVGTRETNRPFDDRKNKPVGQKHDPQPGRQPREDENPLQDPRVRVRCTEALRVKLAWRAGGSWPACAFSGQRGIAMYDGTASALVPVNRISLGRRRAAESADLEAFTSRARIAETARCCAWRRGNSVDLLVDGEQIFEAMFAAIAAARRSILLETYILEADGPGERLAELLAQKCAQGVDVRLMFDSLGSFGTDRAYFDALAAHGVRVREYNPVRPWHKRFRWIFNRRTHRKLLIVDSDVAFIGGANFSRVYSGGSAGLLRKPMPTRQRASAASMARYARPAAGGRSRICRPCFSIRIEQGGSNLERLPAALSESRVRHGWRWLPAQPEAAAIRSIARCSRRCARQRSGS
jgi:hypothetical protein